MAVASCSVFFGQGEIDAWVCLVLKGARYSSAFFFGRFERASFVAEGGGEKKIGINRLLYHTYTCSLSLAENPFA